MLLHMHSCRLSLWLARTTNMIRRVPAQVNWSSMAPRMAQMPNRYLEELSVEQRACLGFPPPGHVYWTAETVDAVGNRYSAMDMEPYRKALGDGSAAAARL